MKKVMLIIAMLAAAEVTLSQPVYHEEVSWQVGSLYYHILTDSTAEVVFNQSCTAYPRDITVPQTVTIEGREYTVTRIGERAFANLCSQATSISLPPTIEEIGREAFTMFPAPITLPESVRVIELGAFAYIQGTPYFHIPGRVERIDEVAFCGADVFRFIVDTANRRFVAVDSVALCSRDTSLLIAYAELARETSYTLPIGVRRIAASAFRDNNSLRTVTLPEGLKEIGGSAFGGGITGVHIPSTVCRIEGAFRDTASASFRLTVASGNSHYRMDGGMLVSSDGDTLLMVLGAAGELEVPSGVRVVGSNAFQFNNRLGRVNLPEGLTDIGEAAFAVSSAEVVLPSTLRSIGEQAFYANTGTERVSLPSLEYMGKSAFEMSGIRTVGSAERLRDIPSAAFRNSPLTTFEWGDQLETIGEEAFYAVPMTMSDKTFPASLKGIGMKGLLTRNKIMKVTFLGSVDTIGAYALNCRRVRFRDTVVPAIYTSALYNTDTVFAPCGYAEVFLQAVLRDRDFSTVFADWCDTVGVEMAGLRNRMVPYPNPVSETLTITGLPDSRVRVEVYDLAGRLLLRKEASASDPAMDLSHLRRQMLLVRIATDEGCSTYKVMKL